MPVGLVNLDLVRFSYDPGFTGGRLVLAGELFFTIERPWIPANLTPGGEPGRSCVPDGEYELVPHSSARYPATWALVNHDLGVFHFPHEADAAGGGRSAILIHVGNEAKDVRGCIAPGISWAMPGYVGSSRVAFARIREILRPVSGHTITIRAFPGAREEG